MIFNVIYAVVCVLVFYSTETLGQQKGSTIRGPAGANSESRYIELLLVVDNGKFKDFGENEAKTIQHCQEIVNIVNGLYSPLNIYVALVEVVIWKQSDEIAFTSNADEVLANFLRYRREKLNVDHPNDVAYLITKNSVAGRFPDKVFRSTICTFEFAGAVIFDNNQPIDKIAATIAHATGHTLGMSHDTSDCECPSQSCIMSDDTATNPTTWSSCSTTTVKKMFARGLDYCLRDKPKRFNGDPVCGNGFVETGEECDCGLPKFCTNKCCNPTTCKLFKSATCATGECCDLETCQLKQVSTLCRLAKNECDFPEYCTGKSEYCPEDAYKADGETCKEGKAYCYQGACATHDDQCKLLWGASGEGGHDLCYDLNRRGSRHGNCGYSRLNQSYSRCQNEDKFCGVVQCKNSSKTLEFGLESVSILSQSFISLQGSIMPCRAVLVDLGINEVDVGLTPNGAKCGDDKICVNQKCIKASELKKTCPENCNDHGVCNNMGNCYCDNGFAPPFCYPVHGGSIDSGPIPANNNIVNSNNNNNNVVVQWVYDTLHNCSSDRTFFDLHKDDLCNKLLSMS